jgi:hypothetical protein
LINHWLVYHLLLVHAEYMLAANKNYGATRIRTECCHHVTIIICTTAW